MNESGGVDRDGKHTETRLEMGFRNINTLRGFCLPADIIFALVPLVTIGYSSLFCFLLVPFCPLFSLCLSLQGFLGPRIDKSRDSY